MIARESGARYFSLDDAATLALAAGDPVGFIHNQPGAVVLDEIQKAPGLFPAIKLAVDQDRRPGRFLLTGSANVMTLPRLSESLAGRMEILPLYPFSAGELDGRKEGFVRKSFADEIAGLKPESPIGHLPARLVRGGYPEATRRDSGDRRSAWFASYITTILQRDVRDLARVEALHSLPNLLRLLAARTGGLLNLAEVGRGAGLPHTTLTRYLALLEMVFLVHRLPAWSSNLGKRLVKAPKLHLLDTGLACHALGVDARRIAADRTLFGSILETFVVSELRKQLSWTDPHAALHHFRSSSGLEVDVIIEKADGSIGGVEVKAGATVTAADFSALKALREQLGERFRFGVMFYGGEQVIPFGDKLWVAPVPALWAE